MPGRSARRARRDDHRFAMHFTDPRQMQPAHIGCVASLQRLLRGSRARASGPARTSASKSNSSMIDRPSFHARAPAADGRAPIGHHAFERGAIGCETSVAPLSGARIGSERSSPMRRGAALRRVLRSKRERGGARHAAADRGARTIVVMGHLLRVDGGVRDGRPWGRDSGTWRHGGSMRWILRLSPSHMHCVVAQCIENVLRHERRDVRVVIDASPD